MAFFDKINCNMIVNELIQNEIHQKQPFIKYTR